MANVLSRTAEEITAGRSKLRLTKVFNTFPVNDPRPLQQMRGPVASVSSEIANRGLIA